MGFSAEQTKQLAAPLDPKHVKKRDGYDYIEGWHAIDEANRIFGFDGWSRETVELIENAEPTTNAKGNFVVSFRAKVKVTVGDVVRTGIGFGNGFDRTLHNAYEGAIKEAETDAMKRALMTFGNPFGLALYDKKKTNVGTDELARKPPQNSTPFDDEPAQQEADDVRKQCADIIETIEAITALERLLGYTKTPMVKRFYNLAPESVKAEISSAIAKRKTQLEANKEAA